MSKMIRNALLVGVATAAALLLSLALVKLLDISGVDGPRTTLDVLGLFQSRLDEVEAVHGIAFLGDSTGMSGKGQKYSIPGRIDEALKGMPEMPPVISLAEAGLGPIDFYWLASEVAEARPSAVILSLNFGALSDLWVERLSHPEFTSVIGASRWLEAFGLPLFGHSLHADQLVLYPLLEELGLLGAMKAVVNYQARVVQGWKAIQASLARPGGPSEQFVLAVLQDSLPEDDMTPEEAWAHSLRLLQTARYGKATGGLDASDPNLQILGATLRYWEAQNVPVLVVVIPVNVELMGALGVGSAEGTAQTLAALSEVARASGAAFVDLHDILPEESFADPQGHYSLNAEQDGPTLIASRVVPMLVSLLRDRD